LAKWAAEIEPSPHLIVPVYWERLPLGSASVKLATLPLKLAPSVAAMAAPVPINPGEDTLRVRATVGFDIAR